MKTKNIVVALLVSVLGSGCSDFLEETPYNKVTQGNYYTTADGIKGGVNGLYGRLRGIYNQEYFMNVCEVGTDITIWPSSAGRQPVNATTSYVRDLWNACYVNINQANEVIQALEQFTIPGLSDELRRRYLGEARFIRAHLYGHLVKQWGDVPMPLTPTVGIVTHAQRNTEQEVWNQILEDLNYAKENLPASYAKDTEYGRITKYIALHELSRTLLTCKRNDVVGLKLAQEYAEEVINSGLFQLMSSSWSLWDMTYVRDNKEVIFPICYSKDNLLNGGGNQMHMYYTSDYTLHKGLTRSLEYGRPWIRAKTTRYGYELFQNPGLDVPEVNRMADKRAKDWFMTDWKINIGRAYTETLFNPTTKQNEVITRNNGELAMIACPWYNMPEAAEYAKKHYPLWVWIPDHMKAVVEQSGGIQSVSNPDGVWPSNIRFSQIMFYPYLRKHLDPTRLDFNYAQGSRDVFVYRLAETYLLAAEAAFLRGDKQTAADHLNKVRKRAERTDFNFPGSLMVSADEVTADFILDERGRELIGEMHRWYDLKRFGKLTERMTTLHDQIWYLEPAYKFEEYMEKRPYPRDFLLSVANPEDFPNDARYGN